MSKSRHTRQRRVFRTRRPVHMFVACLTLSMGLIGAVAVAAVV